MLALRLFGVCVLAVPAFNPGSWIGGEDDMRGEWALLVDRSASMAVADLPGGASRWSEALRLAAKAQSLSKRPGMMAVKAFSKKLEDAPEGLGGVKPAGDGSDISGSAASMLNLSRSSGRRLAGALLISDGRQTEPSLLSDLSIRARSMEAPCYAVSLGGELAERNLVLSAGRRQYMAFAGHKLKVSATLSNHGLGRISAPVYVLSPSGERLAELKADLEEGGSKTLKFEISPSGKGYFEYAFATPPREGESSSSDNKASFGVNVLDKKVRVLFIEGVPCWDSKFLVQLLRAQAHMDVTSIYRLSSTHFFKVDSDPSKAVESSSSVFPDSLDELGAYDIAVFGRGVEYFLTDERVALLKDFLKERGACVVFSRSKPYSSSFPALEPLEPMEWGETLSGPFSLSPSKAGQEAGLFGEALPGPGDPAWTKLPALENSTRCAGLKPFAQVLADGVPEGPQGSRPFPLAAVQRYGKGIVCAVNAEGFWCWDFSPQDAASSNMYKEFWLQLMEWGLAYSEFLPGMSFSVRLSESSALPDEAVRARVSSRGELPEGKALKLYVAKGGKTVQELLPGLSADGRAWEAVFSLKEPGMYRIGVEGAEGAEAALSVRPPPSEKDNLSADSAFLKRLAESSGGRLVQESDIPSVVAEFEKGDAKSEANKEIWRPSWTLWQLLLLAFIPFACEWTLRRRAGLL